MSETPIFILWLFSSRKVLRNKKDDKELLITCSVMLFFQASNYTALKSSLNTGNPKKHETYNFFLLYILKDSIIFNKHHTIFYAFALIEIPFILSRMSV